ncbi:hypothetical protein K2Y00_03305 [Patescibacteria group bacterium]|nr:hypothetical protein [Patescibacteria group bacterium]
MKRKGIDRLHAVIEELDGHEDMDGVERFYTRDGQQAALRRAEKYLETLRAFRPKTPEEVPAWDALLVEYADRVKRIKKAGEKLERLAFDSAEEKKRAVERVEILLRRLKDAPVVKE